MRPCRRLVAPVFPASPLRVESEEFIPIGYFAASREREPRLEGSLCHPFGGKVKRVLLDADPQLSMRFVALQTQIEESVLRERLMAAFTGAFGVLEAMLALTGVFGVTPCRAVLASASRSGVPGVESSADPRRDRAGPQAGIAADASITMAAGRAASAAL